MSKEWLIELIASGFRLALNELKIEQKGRDMAILDKLQGLAAGNIEIQNAIAEEKAQNESVNESLTQLTDTISAQQVTINDLLAQVAAGNQTLEQAESIIDGLTQESQSIVTEIKSIVNVPEPTV